ncbi:MAG: holo-[acyl-carrier-protein] synthase [Candidatus Aenigmatarchaeota archaeon]|nr:MAG: holo-[acyl-carrier-protein] synthase [Candidatus Aenigmarchaeota archaeon]
MIVGVGVDIESIERFRRMPSHILNRVAKRILTKAEEETYLSQRDPYTFIAGRFSSKEALLKALSPIYRLSLFEILRSVEIVGTPPRIKLSPGLEKRVREMGIKRIHLSISHTRDYVISIVIIES